MSSNCHECLMPPPLFDLPPPPDPSLIWHLLNGDSFDTNELNSIQKFDLGKCQLKNINQLINFFNTIFTGRLKEFWSQNDKNNEDENILLYFFLIFIFLLIFGATSTAIFIVKRRHKQQKKNCLQQKTPSLNSSKYSIETMATGATTIPITTTTSNSTTTTKTTTTKRQRYGNNSPPTPPPRCGNYWSSAALNFPKQKHNLQQNGSYRSATISRRTFALPTTTTTTTTNKCCIVENGQFQYPEARNMLSSQSATNIFGAISQQQQQHKHRHILLAQAQPLQQQLTNIVLPINYQHCSNTLTRKHPRCKNASVRLEHFSGPMNCPTTLQTFVVSCSNQQQQQQESHSNRESNGDAYCTLNRPSYEAYEEIGSTPRTPNNNNETTTIATNNGRGYFNGELEERCSSLETPTIFEDLSENLRFLEATANGRKPPPITRPPPPPLNAMLNHSHSSHNNDILTTTNIRVESGGESSLLEEEFLNGSDCSASSSIEHELQQFNQQNVQQQQQEPIKNAKISVTKTTTNNGRESGYGTNKSRLLGSPPTSASGSSSSSTACVLANQQQQQQQRIANFNGQCNLPIIESTTNQAQYNNALDNLMLKTNNNNNNNNENKIVAFISSPPSSLPKKPYMETTLAVENKNHRQKHKHQSMTYV